MSGGRRGASASTRHEDCTLAGKGISVVPVRTIYEVTRVELGLVPSRLYSASRLTERS